MQRGTALVATLAAAVKLAPALDLTALEADAEISLPDVLLSASDAIYDQLILEGHDPTVITNSTSYESAVAWHFLARLVIVGYHPLPTGLDPPKNQAGQADPYAWSDPYFLRVKPVYAASSDQSRVQEGIPRIKNVSRNALFGGQLQ